jgi:hypothetical protein
MDPELDIFWFSLLNFKYVKLALLGKTIQTRELSDIIIHFQLTSWGKDGVYMEYEVQNIGILSIEGRSQTLQSIDHEDFISI